MATITYTPKDRPENTKEVELKSPVSFRRPFKDAEVTSSDEPTKEVHHTETKQTTVRRRPR